MRTHIGVIVRFDLALLFVVATLAGGCSDPDCEALAEMDATIELGTGEEQFEPVEDGDTLTVDYGPQGGMHVWGAAGTTGLFPGKPPPTPWVDRQEPTADWTLMDGDTNLS